MSYEQIKMIGILYLCGMIVYTIWYIVRNGGFKTFAKEVYDVGEQYGISKPVIMTMAVFIFAFDVLAWPIFMHLDIKERFRG